MTVKKTSRCPSSEPVPVLPLLFRSSSDTEQAQKDASGEFFPAFQAREARVPVVNRFFVTSWQRSTGVTAARTLGSTQYLQPVLNEIGGNNVTAKVVLFMLEVLAADSKTAESEKVWLNCARFGPTVRLCCRYLLPDRSLCCFLHPGEPAQGRGVGLVGSVCRFGFENRDRESDWVWRRS